MKITKDMLIFDILQANANAAEVLASFGMFCVGCMAARGETLEHAAQAHGIDLNALLEKLNEA